MECHQFACPRENGMQQGLNYADNGYLNSHKIVADSFKKYSRVFFLLVFVVCRLFVFAK